MERDEGGVVAVVRYSYERVEVAVEILESELNDFSEEIRRVNALSCSTVELPQGLQVH
jgi:hypothetical protein